MAADAGVYRRIIWSLDDREELCAGAPSGGGTHITASAGSYEHDAILQPSERKAWGKLEDVPAYGLDNFALALRSVDAETGGLARRARA